MDQAWHPSVWLGLLTLMGGLILLLNVSAICQWVAKHDPARTGSALALRLRRDFFAVWLYAFAGLMVLLGFVMLTDA